MADIRPPDSYGELVQLTHRFYYCLDERRYQDLVSLMREDCVWHRQGKVLKGHAMVLAALNERAPTMLIRHVISNAFLEEAGDASATLVAYLTAYRYDDGTPRKPPVTIEAPFRFLLVRKRFTRAGGQWRIAESAGTLEFEFRASK